MYECTVAMEETLNLKLSGQEEAPFLTLPCMQVRISGMERRLHFLMVIQQLVLRHMAMPSKRRLVAAQLLLRS